VNNVISAAHCRKHVYTHSPQYCVFCMFKDCNSGSTNKSSLLLQVYYTAYIVKISFQATNIRRLWRIELLCHQSKILFNISVTCQVHSYTHKAISVSKQKFYSSQNETSSVLCSIMLYHILMYTRLTESTVSIKETQPSLGPHNKSFWSEFMTYRSFQIFQYIQVCY